MFTQTNPSDNPQPGDKLLNPDGSRVAPPVSGPGDRPYGTLGVDKPHGGGNMESEAMADTRVPANATTAPPIHPGPNPNNPADVNNPFSTARSDAAPGPLSVNYATGTGGPKGPVTTTPLPTKNEEIEDGKTPGTSKPKVKAKGRSKAAKQRQGATKAKSRSKAKRK